MALEGLDPMDDISRRANLAHSKIEARASMAPQVEAHGGNHPRSRAFRGAVGTPNECKNVEPFSHVRQNTSGCAHRPFDRDREGIFHTASRERSVRLRYSLAARSFYSLEKRLEVARSIIDHDSNVFLFA